MTTTVKALNEKEEKHFNLTSQYKGIVKYKSVDVTFSPTASLPAARIKFKYGHRGAIGSPTQRHPIFELDRPITGLIVMGSLFLLVCLALLVVAFIFCKKRNTVFAYQNSELDKFDSSFEMDDFTTEGDDSLYDCYYAFGGNYTKRVIASDHENIENDAKMMLLPIHYSNSTNQTRNPRSRPRSFSRIPKSWSCQTNLGRNATTLFREGHPHTPSQRDNPQGTHMGMPSARTYHNFQNLPPDDFASQQQDQIPIQRSFSQILRETVLRRPWNVARLRGELKRRLIGGNNAKCPTQLTNQNTLRVHISHNSCQRSVHLISSDATSSGLPNLSNSAGGMPNVRENYFEYGTSKDGRKQASEFGVGPSMELTSITLDGVRRDLPSGLINSISTKPIKTRSTAFDSEASL